MCRGPLAYGQATAVSTCELIPTRLVGWRNEFRPAGRPAPRPRPRPRPALALPVTARINVDCADQLPRDVTHVQGVIEFIRAERPSAGWVIPTLQKLSTFLNSRSLPSVCGAILYRWESSPTAGRSRSSSIVGDPSFICAMRTPAVSPEGYFAGRPTGANSADWASRPSHRSTCGSQPP